MKIYLYVKLFLLFIFTKLSMAQHPDFEARRMCGGILLMTLKHVCNHNYIAPTEGIFFNNL